MIFLGIFDRRANGYGAIAGMLAGLVFTSAYILGTRSDKIFGTAEPWMSPWLLGIGPEGIGAVGCALNFAVAWCVSRATPPPPESLVRLVDDIRVPSGAHEPESHFDEADLAR